MQRKGFTLIELLIVISILAILASILLFALVGAEGTAKVMRTQSTIAKLNAIVTQQYESYRTRRVPVKIPPGVGRVASAQYRLSGLRELMRMEMPDRLTDIQDDPVTLVTYGVAGYYMPKPALLYTYRRAITPGATDKYQGAECLYLIVAKGSDPDAMSQFAPDEIGDTDGDGMKEFLDAWHNPISFIRWPAGHDSDLQYVVAPISEHDSFDNTHVFSPQNTSDPWYVAPPAKGNHPPLYPLIYSAGPDGVYDIVTDNASGGAVLHYSATTPPNDPYFYDAKRLGTPDDLDGSGAIDTADNITNHSN
jgi:prepilin-type N-terminal cleavage/methylation domain-containing protein